MKTRKNIRRRLAWAACATVLPAFLMAQPANPKYSWLNHYQALNTGTHYADEARAMAIYQPVGDPTLFIAGNFTKKIVIGSVTLTSTSTTSDIYIARINPVTNTVLGAVIYDSGFDDEVWDIGVTSAKYIGSHYVYVAGSHYGGGGVPGPLLVRYSLGLSSPVVADFGNGLGACNEGDAGGVVTGVAVNAADVYVTGWLTGTAALSCATTAPLNQTFLDCIPGSNYPFYWGGGMFAATFNSAMVGTSLLQPQTNACSAGMDIAYYSGRIYITGFFKDAMQFNGNSTSGMANPLGNGAVFTCSAKATAGQPLAFDKDDQRVGDSNDGSLSANRDIGWTIAATANGVFVGGGNAEFGGTFDGHGLDQGPFLVRYGINATNGIQPIVWLNSWNNPGNVQGAAVYAINAQVGNLYATGMTGLNTTIEGQVSTSVSLNGTNTNNGQCGFLANFDITTGANSGKLKWAGRINDNSNSSSGPIAGRAVLSAGCDLYYGGYAGGSNIKIGNTPITVNANTKDSFVAKATAKSALSANANLCLPIGGTVSPSPGAPKAIVEGGVGYTWTVTSGPASGYLLTNASTSAPTITFDEPATYTLQCVTTGGSCPVTAIVNYTVYAAGTNGCPLFQGGGGEDGSGDSNSDITDAIGPTGDLVGPVFTIFPNPSNESLTIRASGVEGNVQVVLFDAAGRILLDQVVPATAQGATLSTNDIGNGLYLCTVLSNGERVHTERVVVQH